VLWHGAARAEALHVCIDGASATATRDQRLAEAVARHENLALSLYRFDGAGDDDGFTAKEFRTLLATHCDMVLGYPVDATDGAPPPGLRVSSPYDQTGYALVTAAALPATGLAGLPQGTEVAVTYGAVPNLYFVTHRNLQADIHLSEADTLKAIVGGQVKAAMLWQPTIAQYLAAHDGAALRVQALQEPHARFNIVALYGPNGAEAVARFEAGLAAVKKSGRRDAPSRLQGPGRFVQPAALALPAPPAGQGRRSMVVPAAVDAGAAPAPAPALYTAAQASAGAGKYSDDCAQCHGAHLEGQSGPALRGPLFASVKSGFTVGDILTFMAINMPATQPGSLTQDEYVDIMAYVLAQNGFPAGQTALTFDGGEKLKIPWLFHGK
jgi:mono/diheme cytochrome c family protein